MLAVRSPLPGRSKAPSVSQNDAHNARPKLSSLQARFYRHPPEHEMSLDDFEELALRRLSVLKVVEDHSLLLWGGVNGNVNGSVSVSGSSSFGGSMDRYRSKLQSSIQKHLPIEGKSHHKRDDDDVPLSQNVDDVDLASHFVLRACYCRTEELRRWFLDQECGLFRHRLEQSLSLSSSSLLSELLQDSGLCVENVSLDERRRLASDLAACGGLVGSSGSSTTEYFKIPFTQALDAVRTRRVVLHRGYVYVPTTSPLLVSILVARFRAHLSECLTYAAASAATDDNDDARFAALRDGLHHHHKGTTSSSSSSSSSTTTLVGGEALTAQAVDSFVDDMPLCMSRLHLGMKRDRHLKYYARLQYTLFLKGAGMSMDESLRFFARHLRGGNSNTNFSKEYGYNIRHLYGKEGKRSAKAPYACPKIIHGLPLPVHAQEHHGCPFRHYDPAHLAQALQQSASATTTKMSKPSMDLPLQLATGSQPQYQLACLAHFQALHPDATPEELADVGNHPNAWLRASVLYRHNRTLHTNTHTPKPTPTSTLHADTEPNQMKD